MQIRQVYHELVRHFRQVGTVLMYHRIAAPDIDPWQLAVSPENFEEHLQVLQKLKRVVPLQQFVKEHSSSFTRPDCIAITFDDGYLDNYLVAKPLLEKYNLPATFFITSRNIGTKNEFWWDELAKILLEAPVLPQQIGLKVAGVPFSFHLNGEVQLTEELYSKHKNYHAFEPVTLRSQLYLKLWELFTPLTAPEQQQLMEKIRDWAGTTAEARPDYCCMSAEQVTDMFSGSLFSAGGHTNSHPALAYHAKEVQRNEIRQNKAYLENLTNDEVRLFAYPSGNYNDTTVEVLQEELFDAAFTTNYGSVLKKDKPYLFNRVQVNNWDGKGLEWVLTKCL